MLNRDYEGQNCSIARALEVVGERWTPLIIRDLLLGLHRFDELQESLGIACNVLTDRLNWLVDEGVLDGFCTASGRSVRVPADAEGSRLNIALTALRQWGDDYLSEKLLRLQRRKVDKKPVVAAIVLKGTRSLRTDEIETLSGRAQRRVAPEGRTIRRNRPAGLVRCELHDATLTQYSCHVSAAPVSAAVARACSPDVVASHGHAVAALVVGLGLSPR
jgi:DNA-binding HxlR family transcriptional regulator